MNIKFLVLLTGILLINSSSFATNYFVDDTGGSDSNNGKSESQAWKSISKVNSMTYSAGDQILFKRGGVWYETLQITSDGLENSPIIYTAYGSGNSPQINGSNTRESGIYLHSRSNIVIENFEVLSHPGEGAIRIMYGQNIEVSDNYIQVTGHGGFFIENSNNILISDNVITTPLGELEKQTDGIYSQRNKNNIYQKNYITIRNSHPTEHLDGIQSFLDEDLTIKDNLIIQDNSKDNSQGIYTTSGTGVHLYYNNIIDCPNTTASVVGFRNMEIGTASLKLFHNTLIGKGANVLRISEAPDLEAKNNIFYAKSPNHSIINIENTIPAGSINYNLYYNGGSPDIILFKGIKKNMREWNAYGYDNNSIKENPDLDTDYNLSPYSGAIDVGTDPGEDYWIDRVGTTRPQMEGFDLGALESGYTTISSGDETFAGPADEFNLNQNHPNPFNPSTVIRFSLPSETDVNLKVYDIIGNEVAELVNETKPSGEYNIEFDGSMLASGIYIYQLRAGNFIQTRKMTLIK